MSDVAKPTELLPLVTDIVAAHLSNNNVPSGELPQLIRDVYHALALASAGGPAPTARPDPAVSIKKSVTPDYKDAEAASADFLQHVAGAVSRSLESAR